MWKDIYTYIYIYTYISNIHNGEYVPIKIYTSRSKKMIRFNFKRRSIRNFKFQNKNGANDIGSSIEILRKKKWSMYIKKKKGNLRIEFSKSISRWKQQTNNLRCLKNNLYTFLHEMNRYAYRCTRISNYRFRRSVIIVF